MSEETQSLTGAVGLATKTGGWIKKEEVKTAVSSYENYHESFGGSDSARKSNYTDMVNKYYDLVTSFYEYGWGESFHFAHRMRGETLRESIKRHEHFLALRLGLGPGMKVLDVGCGIGGPLREIALFSGATVTGLNNNEYQISRGKVLNRRHRALEACGFIKADFMSIPVPDASFDAVYAIEATCHAPDAVGCYSEVKRVLKPGQCFAAYEWCLTDAYDPNNPQHQEVKREVELGNGLPDIRTTAQVRQALLDAGFEVSRRGCEPSLLRAIFTGDEIACGSDGDSGGGVARSPCLLPHHFFSYTLPPFPSQLLEAADLTETAEVARPDGDSGGGVARSPCLFPHHFFSYTLPPFPSQLLEAADLTETAEVAWHKPLDPSYFSLSQFKLTRLGRFLTTTLVRSPCPCVH
ncbi:unnamed protein product [Closterium sp. Naga37s-1]|nr:unnamed protein product [Closterium sp. Naga37s-1]